MSFGKSFLASLLAFIVGIIVVFFLFFLVIGIIVAASGSQDTVEVKSDTILHIKLNSQIVENAAVDPLDFDFSKLVPLPGVNVNTKMGMYQIIENINYAAQDDNIKGIYLNTSGFVATNWANLSSIREALQTVKDSGKFIYAYAEVYSENTYYLASVADSIFLPKEGIIEHNGFVSNPEFYAGLLEKLEVEPKIFRVGTFKSAVEPYIRKDMSEESRLQSQVLLNTFWDIYAKDITQSRDLTLDQLNELTENFVFGKGEDALELGLIDQVASSSDMRAKLNRALGKSDEELNEKPRLLPLKSYMRASKEVGEYTRDRIAVIFVDGIIQMGQSSDGVAGSTTIVNELRKARNDDNIKAAVLRVNSPGGVLLAADLMHEEIELFSQEKPIICSMGNLAASGGYYIAAPCDTIFAQPNTITGSIGIFGVLFNAQDLFNNKLGITFDEVQTHPYANIGNPVHPMTAAEQQIFQRNVEEGYGTFIDVVQKGRNFPDSASVDKIGQGRVWPGQQALELNLVDVMGDLEDAMAYAAQRAGLEAYRVRLLPQSKSPFEELMESMNDPYAMFVQHSELKPYIERLRQLQRYIPQSGVYALMPYTWEIH